MDVLTRECGHDESLCCAVPVEFVRLRYYFGQRLGVVDFADEQAYHAGKQRFHNLRAHGVGVLCGLRAERFVFPQGAPPDTPTTVLRVTRGAALDACGREIVVSGDHCIDVAAWYLQNRSRADVAAWTAGGANPPQPRLWVALRYRECPSDPAPAPRDPCGCDEAGCEYGRVREGFELALLTESERDCAGGTSPSASALADALSRVGSEAVEDTRALFVSAIHRLVAGDCAEARSDGWLCLAQLTLKLETLSDGTSRVVDIGVPDNTIPERASLLTTGALQELLTSLAAGAGGESAVADGPRIAGLSLELPTANTGVIGLPVALASDGAGGTSPLAEPTFARAVVQVHRFDSPGDWADVTPADIGYVTAPTPQIRLKWSAGDPPLAEGRYRLTVTSPFAQPVVDGRLRPLQPRSFARQFRLALDAGVLTLAPSLF